MARKFVMSAVVAFLHSGTPQQAAWGLLITIVFLMVLISKEPYISPSLQSAQNFSLTAQAITLFCEQSLTFLLPHSAEAD